jgi:hypothetical protein
VRVVIADSTALAQAIEGIVLNARAKRRLAKAQRAHLDLLPQVLEEWDRTDLREHLSIESRGVIRRRIKKLKNVRKCAGSLLAALDELDANDQTAIVAQMIVSDGRQVIEARRGEFSDRGKRLDEERRFLAELSRIEPTEFWGFGDGRPRNLVSYFVLQDAASIFEWLTGRKAARGVSRIDATESGPFFRFASTLWPAIFGRGGAGLPAAMKNWAEWRSEHKEQSALIANMARRHPTWGILEH